MQYKKPDKVLGGATAQLDHQMAPLVQYPLAAEISSHHRLWYPVEGEGRAVEGEGRAVEGEGRVAEGEGRVAEGEGRVAEGEGRVAEGEGRAMDVLPPCTIMAQLMTHFDSIAWMKGQYLGSITSFFARLMYWEPMWKGQQMVCNSDDSRGPPMEWHKGPSTWLSALEDSQMSLLASSMADPLQSLVHHETVISPSLAPPNLEVAVLLQEKPTGDLLTLPDSCG
ncbi:hypothetical protein EDC04DRAFT_2610210 [Pisolithus marmoratus]|nr:hypothetical protein EDC04DRAFT_2610210 [Pisolithus marmoratus]